jgi:hypothetical protein
MHDLMHPSIAKQLLLHSACCHVAASEDTPAKTHTYVLVPARLRPSGLTLHHCCLLQVSSDCIKGFLGSLGLPAEVRAAVTWLHGSTARATAGALSHAAPVLLPSFMLVLLDALLWHLG